MYRLKTRSFATADGPRDALGRSKSCKQTQNKSKYGVIGLCNRQSTVWHKVSGRSRPTLIFVDTRISVQHSAVCDGSKEARMPQPSSIRSPTCDRRTRTQDLGTRRASIASRGNDYSHNLPTPPRCLTLSSQATRVSKLRTGSEVCLHSAVDSWLVAVCTEGR